MDTVSEAMARPWVIPAGGSNEHVICVGDDAGKPGRIICILHPANFSYDRLSYDELTAVAALIVEAVNAYEPLKARLAEIEGERDEARAALGRIAQPDDLAADPSNFGAFAEAYLNFAQHIARTALAAEPVEAIRPDTVAQRTWFDGENIRTENLTADDIYHD